MKNIYMIFTKRKIKTFIIWTLSITLFLLASMQKYSALAANPQDINELMSSFPKSISIIFGFGTGSLDIATVGGYFTVLFMYITIAIAIFSASLGSNLVYEEEEFKTSDFTFTRPISRTRILLSKYLVAFQTITIINVIAFVITYFIVVIGYGKIDSMFSLFLGQYIISLFFLSIGTCLTCLKRNKHANVIASSLVLTAFLVKVIFQLKEIDINILTPLLAFDAENIINNGINVFYIMIYLVLSIVMLIFGNLFLNRRDIVGS